MILVCLLLVVDSLDVLISAQSRKFRMKWGGGEMSRGGRKQQLKVNYENPPIIELAEL